MSFSNWSWWGSERRAVAYDELVAADRTLQDKEVQIGNVKRELAAVLSRKRNHLMEVVRLQHERDAIRQVEGPLNDKLKELQSQHDKLKEQRDKLQREREAERQREQDARRRRRRQVTRGVTDNLKSHEEAMRAEQDRFDAGGNVAE